MLFYVTIVKYLVYMNKFSFKYKSVVLNLGSIEPQAFVESVSGIRQR